MDELEQLALGAIQQHQMLKNGDTVIVALSGGADSVALFHFLYTRRAALGIAVCAAHVDHALRPESAQDAAFVRQLCARFDVPLYETRLAPPAQGAGEAWARTERYAFLEGTARRLGAVLATAHTQSDNAETVLLNLARGAGVRGAAGIPPVRGRIVRPLLTVSRAQVEAYLAARGLPHVEDGTNASDVYARNRVRHEVLPALERAHPGAGRALVRFAAAMAETADYLDGLAGTLLAQAALEENVWDAAVLAQAPAPVAKAALAQVIARCAKKEKTALTAAAYTVLREGRGAVPVARGAVLAVRQGQLRVQPPAPPVHSWVVPFSAGVHPLPGGGCLEVVCLTYEKFINSGKDGKKALNFWADYGKIQDNPCFRTRRPGDRFAPAGRGITKSLHKLFSEAKIPPARREALAVLARGSQVLWAEGFGFAGGLCVTRDTKWVVTVSVRRTMEES